MVRLGIGAVLAAVFSVCLSLVSLPAHADGSAYCDAWVNSLVPTRTAPDDELTEVEVGFWPIEVGEIDDKNQTFFADFYVALLWWDPRLEYLGERFEDEDGFLLRPPRVECDLNPKWLTEENHIWNPALEFLALRGDPTVRAQRLLVEPDGSVFYEARYTGTFKAKFDFRKYPFDRQTVGLEVQPFDERDSVILKPYEDYFEGLEPEDLMRGASALDLLEWNLREVTISEQEINWGDEPYSRMRYTLVLDRKPEFFVLNFFAPVALIVILGGAVFWLAPRETETRINLSVTSLLTMVAFNLILRDQLPDLPYATLADIVNSISLLYAMLAVFVVVGIHVIKNRGQTVLIDRLEPWLRYGFPITYLIAVGSLMVTVPGLP